MEFRYINEFAHGAVGLGGIKFNIPLEAYNFYYKL